MTVVRTFAPNRFFRYLLGTLLTFSAVCIAVANARSDTIGEYLAHEKSLIDLFPKIAERQGRLLTVNFKTGRRDVYATTCKVEEWAYGCEGYFLADYDPRRSILTVEYVQDEYRSFRVIDLVSEGFIGVDEKLIAAPSQRAWAGVDEGIGPVSGDGEILWVDQVEGKFRLAARLQKRFCRFTRWEETQLAFVVFCEDGEFRVTLGSKESLHLSPTGRKTSEEEWWSSE